jgi:hypothetical protein
VFVHDRLSGTTHLFSLANGGGQGNLESYDASLSADGRLLAFSSNATNLIVGDNNGSGDIYLRDLQTGVVTRLSNPVGGGEADSHSFWPTLTPDGRWCVFRSEASNLVAGDTNNSMDAFVCAISSGIVTRVSVRSGGFQSVGSGPFTPGVGQPSISDDGRLVCFNSLFDDLIAGDVNNNSDVFVHYRPPVVGVITGYCTPKTNSAGCTPVITTAGEPSLSGNDAFFIVAHDVLPGKSGMMLWSATSNSLPFAGGTLCLAQPIKRTSGQSSGSAPGACTGNYSFHFSQAYMAANSLTAGTNLYAQYWSRDPGFAPPNNIGLSSGISFRVDP